MNIHDVTHLSARHVVMDIHDGLPGPLLPLEKGRISEGGAEDHPKAEVIAAAAPLELCGRWLVGDAPARALGGGPYRARLGDGVGQGCCGQRVHEGLLAATYTI